MRTRPPTAHPPVIDRSCPKLLRKGSLENDVAILATLTNIETDWHRGMAYVGMSRARTPEPNPLLPRIKMR